MASKTYPQVARVEYVLEAWEQATAAEREEGVSWYPRYADILATFAAHTPYTSRQANAVFAVISPQMPVDRNLKYAFDALDAGTGDHLPILGREKPLINGILADPNFNAPALVTGPKVYPFFEALEGDLSKFPVDTHTYTTATGKLLHNKMSIRPWLRAQIVDAVTQASVILGLSARETQAGTWVATARLKKEGFYTALTAGL